MAKASEKLHVTPATISIQLRELEKSLGVKLFRKAGRGLALTEMGVAVQAYANDIFATGQELLDMVHGRPVGGPMVLRVGIKDVMPKTCRVPIARTNAANVSGCSLTMFRRRCHKADRGSRDPQTGCGVVGYSD